MAYNPNSASERLLYSTVRIECEVEGLLSTGSGYLYLFCKSGTVGITSIVTNKHVIKGATKGKIVLTAATSQRGIPKDNEHIEVTFEDFASGFVMHPDSDVDLCILPFAHLLHKLRENNIEVFTQVLSDLDLPTSQEIEEFRALEDILMIGYPNGLWDNYNNKPIMRRGITASHPKFDYQGKKEILIDASCFPGSSGSPVFIFNEGVISNARGELYSGVRSILLGTQFAVHLHFADVMMPNTTQRFDLISQIPNNLGLVIKSERLKDFEPLLNQMMAQKTLRILPFQYKIVKN
ncbi:hypothetical protein D3C72_621930 [compost metagenome]